MRARRDTNASTAPASSTSAPATCPHTASFAIGYITTLAETWSAGTGPLFAYCEPSEFIRLSPIRNTYPSGTVTSKATAEGFFHCSRYGSSSGSPLSTRRYWPLVLLLGLYRMRSPPTAMTRFICVLCRDHGTEARTTSPRRSLPVSTGSR